MRSLIAILALVSFASAQSASTLKPAITPVSGESWLNHLHRAYADSSMGKTWRLGVSSPDRSRDELRLSAFPTSPVVTLHGADLYRLNCRGCHGAAGFGAPPEISSLVDPVRATSLTLVVQRMKNAGMAMSRKEEAEMVRQSQAALLMRLHHGGQDMPAFAYLSEREIRSLIAYLEQLAAVPGSETRQIPVQEPAARVGELLVKSTCHICHDAAGANPSPDEFSQGSIPSLGALPQRVSRAQLIRKVTTGAMAPMNAATTVFRGRMPVFDYIAPREAADAYQYLSQYPPAAGPTDETANSPAEAEVPAVVRAEAIASSRAEVAMPADRAEAPENWHSLIAYVGSMRALPWYGGSCALLFLALGGWFTVHEFRRLGAQSQVRTITRPSLDVQPVTITSAHRVPETMTFPQYVSPEELEWEFGDRIREEKVS